MLDRMAALIMAQTGLIAAEAQALVAVFAVVRRVSRGAIVGVDHVARGAAAAAIVAGMIIRSHKTEQRIVQSHFLQIQDDRIGTNQRTEATVRQSAQRFARRLGRRRDTKLQWLLAPFFKDPQNVSRLAERKAR